MPIKPTIVAAKTTTMSGPGDPRTKTVEQVIQERKYPTGGVFKELFDIDGSIGNRELLNQNFNNPSTEAKYRNAKNTAINPLMGEAGATTQKEISVSRSEIPRGIALDDMMQTIYKNADKAGVNSGQQFLTSFDNLLKSTHPEDQKFLQQYMGQGQSGVLHYDKFKNAAAEQYQRFLDASRETSRAEDLAPKKMEGPKLKVTKTVISPEMQKPMSRETN